MLFVGQRVDDAQPRRGVGEGFDARLRVGAHHGAVHPALEVAGDVLDRFAAAERDVLRRLDHVAAELAHGNLEGRAGAERRLLEEQRDVLAFERADVPDAGGARVLQLGGQPETGLELRRVEVANREETCRRRHIDLPLRCALHGDVLDAVCDGPLIRAAAKPSDAARASGDLALQTRLPDRGPTSDIPR